MSNLSKTTRFQPRLEGLEDRSVPAFLGPFYSNISPPLNTMSANVVSTSVGSSSNIITSTKNPTLVQSAPTTTLNTTVTPTLSSTTTQAVFSQAETGQERTGTINKFDPTLGALTSVEIIATGSLTAQAGVENVGFRAGVLKTDLVGTLSYKVAGLSNPIQATLNQTRNATVGAYDGNTDFGGSSGRMFTVQADAANATTVSPGTFQKIVLNDQASLKLFSGNGTIQVLQDSDAEACVCGPGNLVGSVATKSSGNFQVIYKYTPLAQLGSIAGYVYHDVNKNGAYNPGDRMIAGVTISLTGTDVYGNAVSRTTVTGANGWFTFARLTAGTYSITQTQPAGYAQGVNQAGTLGGTPVAGSDTITGINVTPGASGTAYTFGEIVNGGTTPGTPPKDNPPSRAVFDAKFAFSDRSLWRF